MLSCAGADPGDGPVGVFVALLFSLPAGGTTAWLLRDRWGFQWTLIACIAGLAVGLAESVAVSVLVWNRIFVPDQAVIGGVVLGVLGAAVAANRTYRTARAPDDLRKC